MDRIESLLKRPPKYGNIDGVGELSLGFCGMGFFVLMWMQAHSSHHSFWNSLWTLFVYGGLMAVVLHFGTKAIKERVTYPRTGFVSYRKSKAAWVGVIAFAVAALAALAIVVALRKSPAGSGTLIFLIGGLFVTLAYAFGIAREVQWKWIAASAMVIAAIIVAFLPTQVLEFLGGSMHLHFVKLAGECILYMFLWSAIALVSGSISLWIYVHHTSLPKAEAE